MLNRVFLQCTSAATSKSNDLKYILARKYCFFLYLKFLEIVCDTIWTKTIFNKFFYHYIIQLFNNGLSKPHTSGIERRLYALLQIILYVHYHTIGYVYWVLEHNGRFDSFSWAFFWCHLVIILRSRWTNQFFRNFGAWVILFNVLFWTRWINSMLTLETHPRMFK